VSDTLINMKVNRILLFLLLTSQSFTPRSVPHHETFMAEEEQQIHVPTTATRYPEAQRNENAFAAILSQSPKNINVISKRDLVLQGTINGQMVETCTPGKQVPQNEVTGAINPQNPKNLVMGSNDYQFLNEVSHRYDSGGGFYRSIDEGQTWTNGFLPKLVRWNTESPGAYEAASDPSISASSDNVFWYSNLLFNRSTFETSVAASRSIDGGATWKTTYVIQNDAPPDGRILLNDKPWIAADPSNPETAYITWTRFQKGSPFSPIVYSSTNNGGKTWSRPKVISSKLEDNQGSDVVISDTGAVHVVWFSFSETSAVLEYSRKLGARFTRPKIIANIDQIHSPVPWGHFFTNSFPALAVDGETLHVVWPNWNGKDADIVYIRSEDGGDTWSQPVTLDNQVQDQFLPRIAVHNGLVAVGYLDHNKEPGSGYHVSFVASRDGGKSWSKPKKISSKRSNPEKGNLFSFPTCEASFIGDYNGIAVGADRSIHVFWTDIRSGNSPGDPGTSYDQDPYTASIQIP
jgi:hypothetical protein